MAKIDPKVQQTIASLEAKLLLLKNDKIARENTQKLINGIKQRHGIK